MQDEFLHFFDDIRVIIFTSAAGIQTSGFLKLFDIIVLKYNFK